MKITLGFSPCPNDTFIFDALVNKKIETEGIDFEVRLEDVQTLNQLALQQALDLTKISYGVLPYVLDNYVLLNSGGALGNGVGPLLITGPLQTSPRWGGLENILHDQEFVNNSTIAIPGENTTAHMLFALAFPNAKNKIFLRYDEIENFVLNNPSQVSPTGGVLEEAFAGVIIHENRFTYQQKGLKKIIDLGDFWQSKTGSPIPLGGIVGKRKINTILLKKIDALIKQSIEYAFRNYPQLTDYIREHSQEMEEDVMRKHIELYVNNYSIDLGEEGKKAVKEFLKIFENLHPEFKKSAKEIFL